MRFWCAALAALSACVPTTTSTSAPDAEYRKGASAAAPTRASHPKDGADDASAVAARGDEATPPSATLAPSLATPAAGAVESASTPEPGALLAKLPAGTVVLHVGDSMGDALGGELKRELEARGIRNIVRFKEATYIPQWASRWDTMGFRSLLAVHQPQLVIITLGGNELAMPDPSVRAEPIREMVKAIGDRPCLWLAAPLWPNAPNTGLLDVIRANCAPCTYVDTNALVGRMKTLGDKVHPTLPERKRWANAMLRWMDHNLEASATRPWTFRQPSELPPPGVPIESAAAE